MYKARKHWSLGLIVLFLLGACSSVKVKSVEELNNARAIYEEALKLVAGAEYSKAIEYFQFVVKNFPGAADEKYVSMSTYEIGFSHYRNGDDEKAIEYFDKVLAHSKTRRARVLASLVKTKIQRGDGYKNTSYN
ncbi:MAG: hypothetical protein CVV50_01170 [Spirochaetae bacterium HGW-Spirochaetae-6]|nr:MAG: hypothetical protein CVV50_01170 [Spirochaetae bacterium HGW-Spirochaetae-6]